MLTASRSLVGQITEVSNITSTPIAGSGHDYLADLSEIVNPANGSVSIRIAAPTPYERGTSNPLYAYTYDTNGLFVMSFSSTGAPSSQGPPYQQTVLGPFVTPPVAPSGFLVSATYAAGSLNYEYSHFSYCSGPTGSGGCGVKVNCYLISGYTVVDPSGGRHTLGTSFEVPTDSSHCIDVGVSTYNRGGDEQYKIDLSCYSTGCSWPTNSAVVNLHGDELGGSGITEDTNGNYMNTDGRPWSSPYSYTLEPGWTVPTSMTFPGLSTPYAYTYGGTAGTLYSGTNPLNATLRYNNYASLFPQGCQYIPPSNAPQIGGGATIVQLPSGQQYTFTYDPVYGFIKTITYPTGATVTYTWQINPQSEIAGYQGNYTFGWPVVNTSQECIYTIDMPALKSRIVKYDGVTPAVEQDFSYTTKWNTNCSTWGYVHPSIWIQKTTTVTTTDLIRPGHPSFQTLYTYVPMASANQVVAPSTTFPVPILPVESSIVYKDFSGKTLRTVTKVWNTPNQLAAECVTLDNLQTSGTFYTYAPYAWGSYNTGIGYLTAAAGLTDLVTDKAQYDYGTVTSPCQQPASTPIRETKTTYASLGQTPFWQHTAALVDRPQAVQVYGNGTLVSETDYAYDDPPLAPVIPPPYGHDETNYGPSPTTVYARGNATTITKKCWAGSVLCTNSVWKIAYDTTGQPVSVTDANGNTTSIAYADQFASGSGTPPSQPTNQYITKITRPVTNGVSHIETFQWNYNQGELAVATDENLNKSYFYYNDPWNRIREADYPDGRTLKHAYQDSAPIMVTTCKLINGSPSAACNPTNPPSGWETDVALKDGMGHVVKTELASDPQGLSYTATSWDGNGKPYQVYNPTRCSTPMANCGTETTWGVTTYLYDAIGRSCLIVRPDVGSVPTSCPTTLPVGDVFTTYSGNCTTVYDEAGNARRSCVDALGRVTGVWEDPAGLNYETDYAYDALNNLLSVTQNGSDASQARIRTFSYDSLSRLLCAANPEVQAVTCPPSPTGAFPTGAVTYGYDGNGNVITKVAPMPNQTGATTVATNYKYDALNRLLSKSYSSDVGSTPSSCYQYDVPLVANGVGRLANEWTQSPSAGQCPMTMPTSRLLTKHSILAFDSMGHPTSVQQCTPFNCSSATQYSLAYTYDLAGDLNTYTNGIGSTPGAGTGPLMFTNVFNGAGRLQSVTSTWNDALHMPSLFSATSTSPPAYAPQGALQDATYGNGLQLIRTYDDRLRITGERDTGGH